MARPAPMSAERWRRLKALFGEALARAEEERSAFIAAATAGDPALRAELEALVASHVAAGSFLEIPAAPPGEPAAPEREPPAGRIGPYRIVRELGHGGMGTVWLGERDDEEFRRRVAIKVIRRGMDHAAVVARFRKERQILADLAHPNIATLLDGGTTEDGRPFFVMEHVDGVPIDAFCDGRRLPIAGRIELFLPVCAAVAYAHGRQVVHRDLKPGNVLVTREGVPKLLDFGLARLVDPGGPGDPTAPDLRFFTPAFASPEQIAGGPVGPESDVWSLGAMLFVLATGRRPRDLARPGGAGGDPIPPSAAALRRAGGGEASPAPEQLAAVREGTPSRLRGRLAGDLDAVVLRALEPVVERRYRSAAELADDLRRHLDGRPVLARRARGRRPRWAGALGLLAALAAAGVALSPARSPRPASRERVTVAVADLQNQTGEAELSGLSGLLITSLEQSRRFAVLTRSRVADLLREMKRDPSQTVDEPIGRELGRRAGVRVLLLPALRRFDDLYVIELKALDPLDDRYLFAFREEGHGRSSLPGAVDRLSDRAREALREDRADVETSRVAVADVTTASLEAYQHYFRGEQLQDDLRYAAALEEYRRAVAIDPTFALAHYQIAYVGKLHGLDPAARRAALEASARFLDRTPPKERLLIRAWDAHERGQDGEARALYERAVALHPQDKQALYLTGDFHYHGGRYDEALPYFERAVALDKAWEPALMHLTDTLYYLGRAQELLAQARGWAERAPGPQAFRALAWGELTSGHRVEAVAVARRAFDGQATIWNRSTLCLMLLHDDRYAEAEALARGGLRATTEPGHRALAGRLLVLALSYQGRRTEALRALDALAEGGDPDGTLPRERLLLVLGGGDPAATRCAARPLADGPEPPPAAAALALALSDDEGAERAIARLEPGIERSQCEAAAAWRRGDREGALRRLRELAARPAPGSAVITDWLLARVLLDDGRPAEAIAALERLRAAPGDLGSGGGTFRSWAYGDALYLEAAAHEHLGDRARARERLDPLLAAWRRADRGHAGAARARALRARLASDRR